MKIQEIIEKIQDKKGASLNVQIISQIETLRAYRGKLVEKITKLTIISGVAFGNRKDIKEAIESGERGEIQSLAWGTWQQFPFHISHKGQDYVRLYLPSKGQQEAGFLHETMVQFRIDGRAATREEAIEICGSKAAARANEQGVMTVKASGVSFV